MIKFEKKSPAKLIVVFLTLILSGFLANSPVFAQDCDEYVCDGSDENTLSSMLYSLKFAGCSITDEEIQKYKEIMG